MRSAAQGRPPPLKPPTTAQSGLRPPVLDQRDECGALSFVLLRIIFSELRRDSLGIGLRLLECHTVLQPPYDEEVVAATRVEMAPQRGHLWVHNRRRPEIELHPD